MDNPPDFIHLFSVNFDGLWRWIICFYCENGQWRVYSHDQEHHQHQNKKRSRISCIPTNTIGPKCLPPREVSRDLTKPRPRRQRERPKTIGLMNKTTILHVHHAFFYISLLSLHNYDVKLPNIKFTWERERQGDKFYHLCPNLSAFSSLQLQPKFPSFK